MVGSHDGEWTPPPTVTVEKRLHEIGRYEDEKSMALFLFLRQVRGFAFILADGG